jgi:hypothetical protein
MKTSGVFRGRPNSACCPHTCLRGLRRRGCFRCPQDLNEKLKIAQRSREADARRHKLETHELRKEAAGLKKEVARMAAEVEVRFANRIPVVQDNQLDLGLKHLVV